MPSIGKDLATIRKHLGLSIDDIQNATKIPLQTLKSIEDNSIFEDSDEIQTYIRSFVRTYGRKLKLDDELVVEALDRQEVGGYDHQLLQGYPELAPPPSKKETEDKEEQIAAEEKSITEEPDKSASETTQDTGKIKDSSSEKVPPISKPEPKAASKPVQQKPTVRNVDWADMGKKFSKKKNGAPVQLIGIGVIVIFIIAIAYFVFTRNESDSGQSTVPDDTPVPEETLNDDESGIPLDLSDSPDSENNLETDPSAPAELSDTLFVTLYAAVDRLDPVRVWSDLKPRIDPYWIDQGVALNFEFRDTLRFRGQYSRMLVFMNGHRIDNFRDQYFNAEENSVELTRDIFEDDSKWASPIPLELPTNVEEPDSVSNRPSF